MELTLVNRINPKFELKLNDYNYKEIHSTTGFMAVDGSEHADSDTPTSLPARRVPVVYIPVPHVTKSQFNFKSETSV